MQWARDLFPYESAKGWTLFHGDCGDVLQALDDASVDSLVTDPPAGIAFMGKDWDGNRGGRAHWITWMTGVMREALRVLKPGAHGLVWALPRTSHWTATALEDAGFEVRDVIMHLFGTGFPKSLDVSKAIDKAAGAERELGPMKSTARHCPRSDGWQRPHHLDPKASNKFESYPSTDAAHHWSGWGTALKPASEHWILVRKPLGEKTVAANVLKHGTGAINVDAGRIGTERVESGRAGRKTEKSGAIALEGGDLKATAGGVATGRFPANVTLDEEAAKALDEQSGHLHGSGNKSDKGTGKDKDYNASGYHLSYAGRAGRDYGKDGGGASRFFYVAKASRKDRGEGNTHPTVKSTALMRYLIKLITPPNGRVLDPFSGSGSTGVAARAHGFKFCGIEQDRESFRTAVRRLR